MTAFTHPPRPCDIYGRFFVTRHSTCFWIVQERGDDGVFRHFAPPLKFWRWKSAALVAQGACVAVNNAYDRERDMQKLVGEP